MTLSQKPGLGNRLAALPKAVARLSPRKRLAVTLLAALVMLTWLAACAILVSLFV
jgi:hypothetical protein